LYNRLINRWVDLPCNCNYYNTHDYKIYFDGNTLKIENYARGMALAISNTIVLTEPVGVGLKFPQVPVEFCWGGSSLIITEWKGDAWVELAYEGRQLSHGSEEPPVRDNGESFIEWFGDGVLIASTRSGKWVKFFYVGNITRSDPEPR
jgi:hypothetical protein